MQALRKKWKWMSFWKFKGCYCNFCTAEGRNFRSFPWRARPASRRTWLVATRNAPDCGAGNTSNTTWRTILCSASTRRTTKYCIFTLLWKVPIIFVQFDLDYVSQGYDGRADGEIRANPFGGFSQGTGLKAEIYWKLENVLTRILCFALFLVVKFTLWRHQELLKHWLLDYLL